VSVDEDLPPSFVEAQDPGTPIWLCWHHLGPGGAQSISKGILPVRSSELFGDTNYLLEYLGIARGQLHLFSAGNIHGIHSAAWSLAKWDSYDPVAFRKYYRYQPFLVAHRVILILAEIVMLTMLHWAEKDVHKRAAKLRHSLIRLGPFYIKLAQALSTRPDILPNAYCQELAKLQDRIPPFPTPDALKFIEQELGSSARKLFAEISDEPIAAASLGQVYKARLHSGEDVAVKVQRPGVSEQLALDAHLLRLIGGQLQRFAGTRSDLIAVVDEMVSATHLSILIYIPCTQVHMNM
jgi:hypothetical protein